MTLRGGQFILAVTALLLCPISLTTESWYGGEGNSEQTGDLTTAQRTTLEEIGFESLVNKEATHGRSLNTDWQEKASGTDGIFGNDFAVDSEGNTYIVGVFGGTAAFGNHAITSQGGADVFVAKLDINGNWVWAEKASGPGTDIGSGIALDEEKGALWVTGSFWDSISFTGSLLTSTGRSDGFLALINVSGAWMHNVGFGGTGDDAGKDIVTIEGSHEAYITGHFENTMSMGNAGEQTSAGQEDIFVAKYALPSADWEWAVRGGGTSKDFGSGIIIDENDGVFVTGTFISADAAFGTNVLHFDNSANSGEDIFVGMVTDTGTTGEWSWA